MKAVILGATRGMGRAIARKMADRGDSVFILGNDAEDAERSANDLTVRANKAPFHSARRCETAFLLAAGGRFASLAPSQASEGASLSSSTARPRRGSRATSKGSITSFVQADSERSV